MTQPDLLSYLGPDDAGRTLQGRGRVGPFGVGAVHRVEHGGLTQVVGQPGFCDGDEPEPGVLDPPLEHLRDDLADPVREHRVRGRRGYHRHADLGPPVQIQVPGLGDRGTWIAPA